MKALNFPNLFTSSTCKVANQSKSIYQDLYMLLKTPKGSLFGDPYFGTNLYKFLYEQNSIQLVDIIIDEIYMNILEFIPYLTVRREDIMIEQHGTNCSVTIRAVNNKNGISDLYTIRLISESES